MAAWWTLAAVAAAVALTIPVGAQPAPPSPFPPSAGTHAWPVTGPVVRGFEEPPSPYAAGPRGIDIQASPGTTVRATAAGVVAFAGRVAGDVHVSIDHPDGVRTSYAFLSSTSVRTGDPVLRGAEIGSAGPGHPDSGAAHLHLGARYAGRYIDPMVLLERRSLVGLIRLAPLPEPGGREPAST